MNYQAIDFTEEQIDSLVPARVAGLYGVPGFRTFAAIEDANIHALTVMTPNTKDRGYVINHLAFSDEGDEVYLRELLVYIEKSCKESGITSLYVRLIDEKDVLAPVNKILLSLSYEPIYVKGRYLLYDYGDLKKTKIFRKIPDVKTLFSRVSNIEKTTLLERTILKRRIEYDKIDKEFGLFYKNKGIITGFLDFRKMGKDLLYLNSLYVNKKSKDRYILPVLIAYVLDRLDRMGDDDTVIIIPLYDEQIYRAILSIFPKPKKNEMIYEYYKNI